MLNGEHTKAFNDYMADCPKIADFKPGVLVRVVPWSDGRSSAHKQVTGMILHEPDTSGRCCILFGETKTELHWTVLYLVD